TTEPYDSIYIFCTDTGKAAQWAAPHYEYVKIFSFEADLLTRLTKDLGEEFLNHGQELLAANQIDAADERLTWAKSLFIRHDKLKFIPQPTQSPASVSTDKQQEKICDFQPTSNQQGKPSEKLIEIDRLLAEVHERVKQRRQDNDLDHDELPALAVSNQIIIRPDHCVVWLDERLGSCQQAETAAEHETDLPNFTSIQQDNSSPRYLAQLEHEMKICFFNTHESVETFDDIDACCQYMITSTGTQTIFFITSSSFAEKILPYLAEKWNSIKIYILGDYVPRDVDLIHNYQGSIQILLFDLYKNLLIRILQDISKHYLSKGVDHGHRTSSAAMSALVYFNWAKETAIRANQLSENDFRDHLNDIEKRIDETEKLIKTTQFTDDDTTRRMEMCSLDEDSDSVVIIFIVGLEMELIRLDSGIGQLITCTTNAQLMLDLPNLKSLTPILIVSRTLPSDDLLSRMQLLHYYFFSKPQEPMQSLPTSDRNVSYVYSIDHLMSELYHKLGQHYRKHAFRASLDPEDQHKAKRLLQKSTQCYKLLECDTEKTLKRYAEMLK
ncbi:unnamed protein product, partial [Didymodactylos carnosus]